MAEFSNQIVKSFIASATIPSGVVVTFAATTAAHEVRVHDTSSSLIVGVSADYAEAGQSVPIVIGGTARVICGDSITAGALLGIQTATGYVVEAVLGANLVASAASLTATVWPRTLGISLGQGQSTGAVEVLLQIQNRRVTFG